DGLAALRWVVLDPTLRGSGLGKGLIGEVVEAARSLGYDCIGLDTFSEVRAAAHIYRSHGFEVRWSETGPRWGRERITYQRYELNFHVRAQFSSPPSTRSRETPLC